MAFQTTLANHPEWKAYAPIILYATLGEALFNHILGSGTGVAISTHAYGEVWELVRQPDKKIHLAIPEMLAEWHALAGEADLGPNEAYPFVLAAGERRSYNASQIFHNPAWRKNDPDGALHIHPDDAASVGVQDGQLAVCESSAGAIEVRVAFDETMCRGFLALPHGYGMVYPDPDDPDRLIQNGPSINLLTSSTHCDPTAKTPYHKYVPVRVRLLA